VSYIISRLSI
jgi:cellulose 1,4-beta-cellobiosidase